MARVAIIGAGVAGLGTALALSRQGHDVSIVERDATPTPGDPDAAFAWDRRGAPQVRHSHALLARLRNLLRDRYPDVLEQLLDAGATEIRFADMLPPDIDDPTPQDGDDDLVALACRRTTFEWVLRRVVLADPRVRLLDGRAVDGLIAETGDAGAPPRVAGVHVSHDGQVEQLPADIVVATTGRRSAVPQWLGALGVDLELTEEDTGIVYLSRFYRLRDGVEPPTSDGPIGGDLGYLKYAVFQGDNRTFSVTFAVRTHDRDLRAALLEPATFDRAARLLPATSPWADASLAEPITPVHVMAGLLNRIVRYVDPEGEPVALGFYAAGDAHTCTNPLYGRGCSLAMVQADLLADALAAHPDDPREAALAYERASAEQVEPWYRASVAQDRAARQQARQETPEEKGFDEAEPATDAPPTRDEQANEASGDGGPPIPPEMMRDLLRDGLLPAVRLHANVFRAFIRGFNLLEPPQALLADAEVVARVLETYQARDERPPEPSLGPPRSEMLEQLTA